MSADGPGQIRPCVSRSAGTHKDVLKHVLIHSSWSDRMGTLGCVAEVAEFLQLRAFSEYLFDEDLEETCLVVRASRQSRAHWNAASASHRDRYPAR